MLSVTELNEQIKSLIESHFRYVLVEGEISSPYYHKSGHIYFTLKDERSVLKCVMFKSRVKNLKFELKDGLKVVINGEVGVYSPKGEYQLYANSIEPLGIGALKLAFEQLKSRLEKKGYFDNKKDIPKNISTLAIVTSIDGAALTDMKKVLSNRWPFVKVYVVDTLVQGEDAPSMIAKSIDFADSLGVDAIIVSRGGGSIEDLWAFNEEVVAEAIFKAKTPIVSAVGHERDYLISDFVADLRAPTPSAAIEMMFPDKNSVLKYIDDEILRFNQIINQFFLQKTKEFNHIAHSLTSLSPVKKISMLENELKSLFEQLRDVMDFYLSKKSKEPHYVEEMLNSSIDSLLNNKEHMLTLLNSKLQGAFEAKKLPSGVAQIVKDSKAVSLDELNPSDIVELQNTSYVLKAKILEKNEI